MQLYKIRGGNKEDLEAKKYTIGIGISLGNKWFTPENIFESIKWALEYSKGPVVVYISDSIHAINLSVRNSINFDRALRLTARQRDKLFEQVKSLLTKLSEDQRSRIIFVTWDEIVDEKFKEKLSYLRSLYESPTEFREVVHTIVKNHVSKESRKFSEEEVHKLGEYIISEMPEFLTRVKMKGIVVDAYTYPYDNEVTKFAESIQKGEILPEIKAQIMDTESKVFLEVR